MFPFKKHFSLVNLFFELITDSTASDTLILSSCTLVVFMYF